MKILLVDNGSFEPASTLALRILAGKLSDRIGQQICPVSLLHSDKVLAEKLHGEPADIFETFLRRDAARGEMNFQVLPLFFGPSRAITEYLPAVVEKLRKEFPSLRVAVASTLYQADDKRLAEILEENVRAKLTLEFSSGEPVRVALVDHGSPVAAVTAVRDAVAKQLALALGDTVSAVTPCSMERRPGVEYDFNEPLLEKLLTRVGWNAGPVIVAQLFLMPGRHAGPTGDIATICQRAESSSPKLSTIRTEVLGAHPGLIEILRDRYLGLVSA